jgi:hypothetical protein
VVSLTLSKHSAEALNNRHMHQTNHKNFTKYRPGREKSFIQKRYIHAHVQLQRTGHWRNDDGTSEILRNILDFKLSPCCVCYILSFG